MRESHSKKDAPDDKANGTFKRTQGDPCQKDGGTAGTKDTLLSDDELRPTAARSIC